MCSHVLRCAADEWKDRPNTSCWIGMAYERNDDCTHLLRFYLDLYIYIVYTTGSANTARCIDDEMPPARQLLTEVAQTCRASNWIRNPRAAAALELINHPSGFCISSRTRSPNGIIRSELYVQENRYTYDNIVYENVRAYAQATVTQINTRQSDKPSPL